VGWRRAEVGPGIRYVAVAKSSFARKVDRGESIRVSVDVGAGGCQVPAGLHAGRSSVGHSPRYASHVGHEAFIGLGLRHRWGGAIRGALGRPGRSPV